MQRGDAAESIPSMRPVALLFVPELQPTVPPWEQAGDVYGEQVEVARGYQGSFCGAGDGQSRAAAAPGRCYRLQGSSLVAGRVPRARRVLV